jgi:hypothetical protein
VNVRDLFAHQVLASTRQVAQRLHRHRRHEARSDEAVRQQVRQPHRVVHIVLAGGHVLNVHRIGEHEFERRGEDSPDRLPIDPCRRDNRSSSEVVVPNVSTCCSTRLPLANGPPSVHEARLGPPEQPSYLYCTSGRVGDLSPRT